MIVGSIKENTTVEKRVSITPESTKNIIALGLKVYIEQGYALHLGINDDEYKKTVDDAIEFVSGKSRKIQKSLSNQMEKASEDLDFEKAVILRDRIKSLNIIQSSQRINEANLIEADVIAGYKESGKTCIQVFFYRSKQNWGNQAFFPKHDPEEKLGDILNSFV